MRRRVCAAQWKSVLKLPFPKSKRMFVSYQKPSQHTLPKEKIRRKITLYELLEVPPTATQSEIKSVYYELSLKYHPDKNDSVEGKKRFAEITMAYGILGNIDSRRQYDKETGTYHLMRSSHKKGQGEKVLRLTDDTPEIDMYKINESTVYLKTIASLCTVVGQPVRLFNIRTHKGPFGVQATDMRMLRLLRQVCNGTLAANEGQTSVTFLPGELQSGRFTAEAGRFGSLSTLIEGAVPILPFSPLPQYSRHNTLDLKGTTHSFKGMHIDYISNIYQHVVRKFGFDVDYEVRKRSYNPHWEGKVLVHTLPVHHLNCVNLTNRGALTNISGWVFVSGAKPIKVAQTMAEKVKQRLKQTSPRVPIVIDSVRDMDSRSEGTGQGLLIVGNTTTGCAVGGTALWKRGMSCDDVVNIAVHSFEKNLVCETCIDHLMQDQVILLMALAEGTSAVRVGSLNERTRVAMAAIEAITKVKFSISRDSNGSLRRRVKPYIIECQGLGIHNSFLQEKVHGEGNYAAN